MGRMRVRSILQDPLLHFLVLGAVIFVVSQRWQGASEQHDTITLSAADIQRLGERYRQQYGSPPTAEQLRWLTDRHVQEEILYREGLALGLDREDEIVRRRLVQKVEFLVHDRAIIPEPTDRDLELFYWEHVADYATPARVSFSHVYFATDHAGDTGAQARAAGVLAQLMSSSLHRAPDLGDRFPDRHDYAAVGSAEVRRLFGESPFSRAVFDAPVNHWAGPLQSGYGWHVVYVVAKVAPRLPPLVEIRAHVIADYRDHVREQQNAAAVAALRKKYTVVRGDGAHE